MNYQNLVDYFEKYVTEYQPYRDIFTYKQIIKTLIQNFFTDSYQIINKSFVQAFENQEIPVDFHNNLLLSIGYPSTIIQNLSQFDKMILIESFMDFNRYKGTIEQCKNIGEKFNENIVISELYVNLKKSVTITLRPITILNDIVKIPNGHLFIVKNDILQINEVSYIVTNVEDDDIHLDTTIDDETVDEIVLWEWVFIPVKLYSYGENFTVEEFYEYDEIYKKTKKYFITKEFLTSNYLSKHLILPIKTNLLLITFGKKNVINIIDQLIAVVFLKHYRNEKIVLFFKDGKYLTTLENIYKFWFYLIYKYFNSDIKNNKLLNVSVFDINKITYTLHDMRRLLETYNAITNTEDLGIFYRDNIENRLFFTNINEKTTNFKTYENMLRVDIEELIDYCDSRLNNVVSDINKFQVIRLMDEIVNSLNTWSLYTDNESTIRYMKTFINLLSTFHYKNEISPSVMLINFMKPFHTELVIDYPADVTTYDIMIPKELYNEIVFLILSTRNITSNYIGNFTTTFKNFDNVALTHYVVFDRLEVNLRFNLTQLNCEIITISPKSVNFNLLYVNLQENISKHLHFDLLKTNLNIEIDKSLLKSINFELLHVNTDINIVKSLDFDLFGTTLNSEINVKLVKSLNFNITRLTSQISYTLVTPNPYANIDITLLIGTKL